MKTLQSILVFVFVLIIQIVGMHVKIPVPKKVGEWTDKCKLTVQRCKFVYKVWSKCRNKENFDSLIRNGALNGFEDKIVDFMNCDTNTMVNRLKICGGLKGRVKTKLMRMSLILFIKEIKKGFRRNLEYLNTHQKGVKNDTVILT